MTSCPFLSGLRCVHKPPLTHQLARQPLVVASLLATHTTDHLGYCRGCELPQAGPQRWPSTLWTVATRANTIVDDPDVHLLTLYDLVDARAEGRLTGAPVDAKITRMTAELRRAGVIKGDLLND